MDVPNPLQIKNKTISFPYINKNKHSDPVHRLMVDVIEQIDFYQPPNCYSTPLKYVFGEHYPQYKTYLHKHKHTKLQQEIHNYYNANILTAVKYKYSVGQFGYIKYGAGFKDSFVIITEKSDCKREIFFLHNKLFKYKYHRYDITSPTPKILTDNENKSNNQCISEWIHERAFKSIDGTINIDPTNSSASNDLIELLNWKICREDYLLRKLNAVKLNSKKKKKHATKFIQTSIHPIKEDTPTDDTQLSYLPDSDRSSSYYTSTDDDYSGKLLTDSDEPHDPMALFADCGYYKEKHFCYTLKGEIFIAVNKNDKYCDEEVAIKKFMACDNPFRVVINTDLVKQALLNRHLTKSASMRNNIVKYTDFFKIKSDYFGVIEKDFSINLAEFVTQSLKYIANNKLSVREYNETMQYLLWRLSVIIHWLHTDIRCSDLDICPENVMLSRAEFVQQFDGSVAINLKIEVKFIDFDLKEIFYPNAFDKCELKYNKKYFSANNKQYITPNRINNLKYNDPFSSDMWNFGMVIHYCFAGSYPDTNSECSDKINTDCSEKINTDCSEINQLTDFSDTYELKTETDNASNSNMSINGYWSVYNDTLNKYIKANLSRKLVDPKVMSLINGLLNIDETKRLKSIDVLQHEWFNSFYKSCTV